jgi:hypothetical protein
MAHPVRNTIAFAFQVTFRALKSRSQGNIELQVYGFTGFAVWSPRRNGDGN